jgi:hypothetical protein
MPAIDLSILNQRQTPAFYADTLANRPAAGFVGRIFVSTNTFAFFRDNGTGWDLIGGPGTGTITGSGTAGTVPLWNGASTIGNSTLIEGSTKFTTTKDIQADAFYLNGMTAGAGALYYDSVADRVTIANYNPTGIVHIEVAGGAAAQIIAANLSTTFYGNIIRNGGTSSQFLKADGSLDSNTYNTGSGVAGQVAFFSGTNAITGNNDLFWDNVNGHLGIGTNVPGTALQIDHDQSQLIRLNQTTATNDTKIAFQNSGTALWRIGNSYNAGANDFGIFDVVGAIQPITVKKTTGQVLIGTSTVGSGKLVVASSNGDNGVQIVGAAAPSLRIDNAESGPTKRAGFGISTATNNFIQGSADRDFCMFNGSTTASPILFGIYDTTNVQEAARISAARNFLIGTTTDAGFRLNVAGTGRFIGANTTDRGQLSIQSNNISNGARATWYYDTFNSGEIGTTSSDFYALATNNFLFYAGGSPRLQISSNGNVGINTNNPGQKLTVFGGALAGNVGVMLDGGDTPTLQQYALTNEAGIGTNSYLNKPLTFKVNMTYDVMNSGTEVLRMTNSANVLIGTTTDTGQKLQVNGNIVSQSTGNPFFGSQRNGGNQYGFYSDGAGSLILVDFGVAVRGNFNMGTGVYTATSDINKKKDFELSNLGLNAILGLKPTLYRMKEDKEDSNKYLGFLAQEVKEFIPQSFVEKDDFIGLDYQPIIATLVKAIQELNIKIENLKN